MSNCGSDSEEVLQTDYVTPSEEEWQHMKMYQSFTVPSGEHEEKRFPLNVYALIVPEGVDPECTLPNHDYWVGKIKEIRSRGKDNTEVWAKVQWLWSAHDISRHRYLPVSSFGLMERVLSNHYDFVHASCFQEIAAVVKYNDCDIQAKLIDQRTFYRRFTFDINTKNLYPDPYSILNCLCSTLSKPDGPPSHFCPNQRCQKWYHSLCLRKGGFLDRRFFAFSSEDEIRTEKRIYGRKKISPEVIALRSLEFERAFTRDWDNLADSILQPGQLVKTTTTLGRKSYFSPDQNTHVPDAEGTLIYHSYIPSFIVRLSKSPIVKGRGSGLPHNTGTIVGNIAIVLRARRIVDDILNGRLYIFDNEDISSQKCEIPCNSSPARLRNSDSNNKSLNVLCNILAGIPSQDGAYDRDDGYGRTWRELDRWAVQDSGFVCPECKGPI